VPFINRIHPVRLTASKEEGNIPLASLDFLKLSLFDLESLTRALTFENFSEVQSTEAGIRRLGFTGIIGGTLLHVQQPFLILQSCVEPSLTARILISTEMADGFGGDPKHLRELVGKPVRILCTGWYEPRKATRSQLEGFALQPADNVSDITEDEVLGYIRIRRRVARESLMALFKALPSKSSRLTEHDDLFEWATQPSHGSDVADEFSKCEGILSGLRASAHDMWLAGPEKMFGAERLSLTSIGERISRDPRLLQCANAIIRTRDLFGTLPATWVELRREIAKIEPELNDPRVWWFRLMGLVSKSDTGLALTPHALEVVGKANEQSLTRLLDQRLREGVQIFSLIELESSAPFPPSIIFSGLGILAKQGKLVRARGEMLWSTPPLRASELSEEEAKLEQLAAKVLSILESVYHPLGTLRIVEILGERGDACSVFTMGRFLDWMKTRRPVTETESGGWFYPWKDRIRNAILSRPQSYYSENQLATFTSIPLASGEEVRRILSNLVREGVVEEVLPGRWGARLDEKGTQERNRRIMEHGLASYVRANFQGRRMSYENLAGRIEYVILARLSPSKKSKMDQRVLTRKLIEDMISRGEIVHEGPFLRVK
jgi:hypothetical protein